MSNNDIKNKIFGWIVLLLLILFLLLLNYVKFFYHFDNPYINEVSIEKSSSVAIDKVLGEIVDNFNHQNDMKAYAKNHSIYVNYMLNKNIVYEFNYHNMILSIKLDSYDMDDESFSLVFCHLVNSVQMRIHNEGDFSLEVESFLKNNNEVIGLSKSEDNGMITYQIDITKKIVREGV